MSDSNLLIEPLPPGWKNHQFGDVCDRVKDSYQPVDDGETPYVGLEHLAQGFPRFVGRGNESEVKSSKTAFKVGDKDRLAGCPSNAQQMGIVFYRGAFEFQRRIACPETRAVGLRDRPRTAPLLCPKPWKALEKPDALPSG